MLRMELVVRECFMIKVIRHLSRYVDLQSLGTSTIAAIILFLMAIQLGGFSH